MTRRRGLLAVPLMPLSPLVAAAQTGERPPNIVLVLTDDESLAIHTAMPRVKALIEVRGTAFENAFVTYPICCPSRMTILHGQYPHNTGILGDRPPQGGFDVFRALGREKSTVATWLQDAAYRTAFHGKYMNGCPAQDTPPPGRDEWHAASNQDYLNFNYKLNENGESSLTALIRATIMTDMIRDKAVGHIRRFSEEGFLIRRQGLDRSAAGCGRGDRAAHAGLDLRILQQRRARALRPERRSPRLVNFAQSADPARVGALVGRLIALKACAGSACRRAEDVPVRP